MENLLSSEIDQSSVSDGMHFYINKEVTLKSGDEPEKLLLSGEVFGVGFRVTDAPVRFIGNLKGVSEIKVYKPFDLTEGLTFFVLSEDVEYILSETEIEDLINNI